MAERRENHGQTNLVPVPDDDASMPETVVGADLRPDGGTEDKIKLLLQAVSSREAQLDIDSSGKVQLSYINEKKKIPLSHVDPSQVYTIQKGRDSSDVRKRVDVCLKMIEAIKLNKVPSGVVMNTTKMGVSATGQYREGREYELLEEVLGKGTISGDVVVIHDIKSGQEHAMKQVKIQEFCANEVRAWVDLGDSDTFPSLYGFRLVDNHIVFHMEKIDGVTLNVIINSHMFNLHQNAPELVRSFSLCMFHGMLSAITEMHDKNWVHQDLHGGNVMVTKDTMTLKVLDFGMAQRLKEGFHFNQNALKNDILNVIRLFCGLYVGQDFENNFYLEKDIRSATLEKTLERTTTLSRTDREELFQLIMMTYDVTRDPSQEGFGSVGPIMRHIEGKIFPDNKKDLMRKVAAILFPEFYRGDRDIRMQKGQDVADGAEREELNLDEASTAIPEEFLQGLRIRIDRDA